LRILCRLFENPSIRQISSFWRFFWILPLLFFGITILTNSFYAGIATPQSVSFLIVRVLIYAALLLICTLLDAAVRQVHEAEAVRLKAEELAAKTDFYHRMSHDMLTPLTRVSTNIQIAKMKPEKAAELLTEAQPSLTITLRTNAGLRPWASTFLLRTNCSPKPCGSCRTGSGSCADAHHERSQPLWARQIKDWFPHGNPVPEV
jgi:signal transduction histidine kinase